MGFNDVVGRTPHTNELHRNSIDLRSDLPSEMEEPLLQQQCCLTLKVCSMAASIWAIQSAAPQMFCDASLSRVEPSC